LLVDEGGRPPSASLIREVHAILSGAIKQAVVWGWLGHNPAKLATPPAVEKAEVQPPKVEDTARLLAAAMAEDPSWAHPQGRPCGRPPAAAVLAPATTRGELGTGLTVHGAGAEKHQRASHRVIRWTVEVD
jgi:hypothetical protein